jgi:hypothetical protein
MIFIPWIGTEVPIFKGCVTQVHLAFVSGKEQTVLRQNMKITIFWEMMPCGYQLSGGRY